MNRRLGMQGLAAILIGLTAVATGVAVSSVTLVVSGPLLAAVGVLEIARRQRVAADRGLTTALVELVEEVLLQLRSGSNLPVALSSSAPTNGELHDWLEPIRATGARGLTVRAAADALRADPRTGTDDRLRLVAATLHALAAQGGPAVGALRRLRFALAGIGQSVDEAEAQAGQARASSAMMVAAPFVLAVALGAADRSARDLYLYSTSGMICLLAAGSLSYGGWRWMALALDRAVQPRAGSRARRTRDRRPIRRWPTDRSGDNRGLVIELVAMVLAGGGTVRDAVEFVAESGPEPERQAFAIVLDRAAGGALLVDALPMVSDELGSPYRSLVSTLTLSDQGGAAIASTLRQLSDDADAARRRQMELRAKRLSVSLLIPLLLCSLPALVIGAVVPLILVALGHLNG